MTEPTKLSVHLANVVAMIEQIGSDAETIAERFAGDVEGHLRVVESHLMEIINGAKPTPAETAAAALADQTPAESAPVEEAVAEEVAPVEAETVETDVPAETVEETSTDTAPADTAPAKP